MQAGRYPRLLKLVSTPVLALLIVGFCAHSTYSQTVSSREIVDTGNTLDVYTYYVEGTYSHLHMEDSGNFFTYIFDFYTGRSTRVFFTTSGGFTSAIAHDSQLGIVNLGNGWFGSPFYTSGNPFDASVRDTWALLVQEMPNYDPWGEYDGGGDHNPPAPINP